MSTVEFTDRDNALVASVARQLRNKYHGHVELADVQQELYLWLCQHGEQIARWEDKHHEKTVSRMIARSLRNAGEKYCRKEKAARLGYEPHDEFYYSVSMVADILQLYFDPDWAEPAGAELTTSSSGKPAHEGGNLMAMVADVGKAYEAMSPADQFLLNEVYGGERPVREAIALKALEWDCTHNAADKRIRRVVGRVRKELGGPRPWSN